MDDGKVEINPDLSSTVGDVLLATKNDKTDANDSTPTSSTDASSSFAGTSLIVSEDPISSTSSDIMEKGKHIPEVNNEKETLVSKNLLGSDGDVDLLDMNIANVSSELISEDVEDIVQDLENLLGEPEPQHDFPTRRKEKNLLEEKDLLASLDDPLCENIESNLSPQTPETQSLDKTELVEILEKKDIRICSSEVSQNIENEINTDEHTTLKESSESAQEPEINKIEKPSCQPDKVDVAISQSEIVTEEVTVEEKPPEVDVSAVSSSENPAECHSHLTEENIVAGEEIEEITSVELEKSLTSPEDNVENIGDNQDKPILIETKKDEHESKESETLNTQSSKTEGESCDVAQLKTEETAVSDANTVEINADDHESVEAKEDAGADFKQDIGEELNRTENDQVTVEPETSCITSVTEEVSDVLENSISDIVMGSSEVINDETGVEDKQIGDSNLLSTEDIIQEPLETLPEIVGTSVVASEIVDTSVVAAEIVDTSVVAAEIVDTSVLAAEIIDTPEVAAELCEKSNKNDAEFDVNVTSSLDLPIKEDTIEQLKTTDSTISEIQQVESNLETAATTLNEENVALTEELVSTDENVCDGVENTESEIPTVELENPSDEREVESLSENNVESLIDNVEEPANLENLVPGEGSEVEDIAMQNEDVVEVNSSLSPPKPVTEEEQIQEFLITGVETVENEAEWIVSMNQVDKKEILESPEKRESEKECISSIDKEIVEEDASLTIENTNTLLEEELACMEEPSEQNQESHPDEQEIIKEKQEEQSSSEDMLPTTEEGSIPISELVSVENELLPKDSTETDDESTAITDSTTILNEPSEEKTDERTVTSIVQTETTEQEIAPIIPAVNDSLMENLEEDIVDSAAQEETSEQESTVTAEIISLVNEPQAKDSSEENEETVSPPPRLEATEQDCAVPSEIIPIIEESPFEESKEEENQEISTSVIEKDEESNEDTCPKGVDEVSEELKQEQEITIQEESPNCIIEKGDEEIVGSEEPSKVSNEVSEESKQEQEITMQEEITSLKTSTIETVQDKTTPSTELVEDSNIKPCSVESMSSTAEISSNVEEKEDQELHTHVEDEEKIIPDLKVAESISENIESETTEEQKIENLQHSTEENLVPVEEELCVKKVIIYHHDCDSHQSNQSNMQNKDGEENLRQEQNVDTVEEILETESEKLPIVENEELASPIDQQDIEAQVIEQIEEPEIIPKTSDAESGQIEEIAVQTDEDQQELPVEEPVIFEENKNSDQKQEVSSSEEIQHISEEADELEITNQPKVAIVVDPVIETSQTIEEPCDNEMEDQTSAAVQSILDNMSAEESSIVKILEKEEPPVVHSSYSSYEIQKAVQEIQCINQTEDIVEMSHENVECISSTEKLCDPVKPEFQNENLETTHNVGQSDVVTQIGESETSEEPQKLSDIENVDLNSSRVVDDAVEQIQEVMDSPENQESVTQSFDYVEEAAPQAEEIEEKQPLSPPKKSTSEAKQQNDPVVIPSIDLSEESSSEEGSDDEKKHDEVSSSSTLEHKDMRIETSKTPAKVEKVTGKVLSKIEPKRFSPRETRHSSRISDKMNPHSLKEDIGQPLSVNVDDVEKEKPYSPKITIKPIREDEPSEEKEGHKGSLKITITKQSDNTHSILKMCSPDFEHRQRPADEEQNVIPKLVIKTSDTHSEQHSPKTTRSSKQVPGNSSVRSGSPRITIKPIVKPDTKETITSPLKITIKPIGKPEEFSRQQQRHSPKQGKNKSDDDHYSTRSKMMKSSDASEVHSPKVTIKPVKPPEEPEMVSTPKITIKPIEKPDEARVSPKITIKPVIRPVQMEAEVEEEVKERIVLKINRGNLPTKEMNRESRKRELEEDKSEKLAKIKLKFSKDGDAHIVHKKSTETQASKRQHDFETERSKRMKAEATDSDEDVKLIETRQSPIVISEDSQSQDSVILIEDAKDPLADVAIPEPLPQVIPVNAPRKRGRPRKVPLVVRQEFTIEPPTIVQPPISPIPVASVEQPAETETTGRPKRSCRAQSARDTLGIKPRKAYKPRGGKRGAKSISFKPEKKKSLRSTSNIEPGLADG